MRTSCNAAVLQAENKPRLQTAEGQDYTDRAVYSSGIYGYAVFTAVFGYFGLMLLQLSLPWYFIVPADIAMGFIVNFIGMHFLSPAVKSFVNGKAPKPDDLTGYEAVALENIAGSGYGKVRVKYNGLNYRFDAISVYHTDIESGEKVDIVTGEDELLFVQKKDEIYKVLDEEKNACNKSRNRHYTRAEKEKRQLCKLGRNQ